jgi:hypothetical protein
MLDEQQPWHPSKRLVVMIMRMQIAVPFQLPSQKPLRPVEENLRHKQTRGRRKKRYGC